jgi:hypothetical protein
VGDRGERLLVARCGPAGEGGAEGQHADLGGEPGGDVVGAPAGTRWHAAGDEGIPVREIAQSIGDHLGLPTASIPADQLGGHFGFLASVITLDGPVSTESTRRILNWEPTHPGLLADFDTGGYFATQPDPATAH